MAKADGENLEELFDLISSEEPGGDVSEGTPQRCVKDRFRGMILLLVKTALNQRARTKAGKKPLL